MNKIIKNTEKNKDKLLEKINSTVADIDYYCKKYNRRDIQFTNILEDLNKKIDINKINKSIILTTKNINQNKEEKNVIKQNTDENIIQKIDNINLKEKESEYLSGSFDTVDFEEKDNSDLNINRQDSEEIICLGMNNIRSLSNTNDISLKNKNEYIRPNTNLPPPGMFGNYNLNQSQELNMHTMINNLPQKELGLPDRISFIEVNIYGRKMDDNIFNRLNNLEKELFCVIKGNPLLDRIMEVELVFTK